MSPSKEIQRVNLPLLVSGLSFNAIFFELLITRIFAVTLFATQAHLALGLAMLGMSFGSLGYCLFPQILSSGSRLKRQQAGALLQAVAVIIAVIAALYFPVIQSSTTPISGYNQRVSLADILLDPGWFAALLVILTAPFFITGALFASLFAWRRDISGSLYAGDLIGGAVAALLFLPILYFLSGPDAVFASSFLLSAVVMVSSFGSGRIIFFSASALAAVSIVAVCVARMGEPVLSVKSAAGFPEDLVKYQLWTPLTRLAIMPDVRNPGSDIMVLDNASVSQIMVSAEDRLKVKAHGTRSLVYQLIDPPARIAVLAASAGPEVAAAQAFGHTGIDAIDIAGEIFDIVAERYPDAPFNPFLTGNTNRVKADGRSAIMHARAPYDVIQMVHANLWSTAGLLANTWSPSLLETVEAFEMYLSRLSPRGVISMSRGGETDLLVRSAAEALRRRGVKDPERYIFLVRAGGRIALIKNNPWQPEEHGRLLGILEKDYSKYEMELDPLSPKAKRALSSLESETVLLTDDKPYIDNPVEAPLILSQVLAGTAPLRTSYIAAVYKALLVQCCFVVAAGAVLFGVWLVEAFRGRRTIGMAPMLYIAALGYGYLAIEIVLIHRLVLFVGHPVYAITLVVFTMLLTSGLGSYFSRNIPVSRIPFFLSFVIPLIMFFAAIDVFFVPLLLSNYASGLPLMIRIIAVAVFVAPLGFVMGMPFPTGLRMIGKSSPSSIPWAWAVNGWASIVAAVITVIIARLFGYSWSVTAGIAAYGSAVVCVVFLAQILKREAV